MATFQGSQRDPTWNPPNYTTFFVKPTVSTISKGRSIQSPPLLLILRNLERIFHSTMAIANSFVSSSVLPRSKSPIPQFSPFESTHISLIRDECFRQNKYLLRASIDSTNTLGSFSSSKFNQEADSIPMPIVLIDQDSDSDATIVQLSFGDRLGALFDTMKALKDLGLDVTKGTVTTEGSVLQTKFHITHLDTARKVEDPDMLERIRLTIINNLLKYHPESSERLAMGAAFGIKAPEKKLDVDIATHINVRDDGPNRSLLYIETADRPGLILEVIKIMADINIDIVSAEIDTEGLVAKDTFHVNYRGAALNSSLSQVLVNCLRYYLRRPETDEDSY